MILNLNDIKEKKEESEVDSSEVDSFVVSDLPSHPQKKVYPPSNKSVGVIKRVLFTRVEFLEYPSGQVYINKTQSWIEGAKYTPKPKKKKSTKEIKKIKITKKEEY